jgi:hypothetical protein
MTKSRAAKKLLISKCQKACVEYYEANIASLKADDAWQQASIDFDKAKADIAIAEKQCKETSAVLKETKRAYHELRMFCFKHNIDPFNESIPFSFNRNNQEQSK